MYSQHISDFSRDEDKRKEVWKILEERTAWTNAQRQKSTRHSKVQSDSADWLGHRICKRNRMKLYILKARLRPGENIDFVLWAKGKH